MANDKCTCPECEHSTVIENAEQREFSCQNNACNFSLDFGRFNTTAATPQGLYRTQGLERPVETYSLSPKCVNGLLQALNSRNGKLKS